MAQPPNKIMTKLHTTVYSFAPMRDQYGEPDYRKLDVLTRCAACTVSLYSLCYFCFCLLRLCWCYNTTLPVDLTNSVHPLPVHYDLHYVSMGAMAAQVGVQGVAVAFSILFLVGTIKRQQSYVVLWILSGFVLIALETALIVYGNALRTHANVEWDSWAQVELVMYILKLITNLPSLTIATLFYRAIDARNERAAEERRFLL